MDSPTSVERQPVTLDACRGISTSVEIVTHRRVPAGALRERRDLRRAQGARERRRRRCGRAGEERRSLASQPGREGRGRRRGLRGGPQRDKTASTVEPGRLLRRGRLRARPFDACGHGPRGACRCRLWRRRRGRGRPRRSPGRRRGRGRGRGVRRRHDHRSRGPRDAGARQPSVLGGVRSTVAGARGARRVGAGSRAPAGRRRGRVSHTVPERRGNGLCGRGGTQRRGAGRPRRTWRRWPRSGV